MANAILNFHFDFLHPSLSICICIPIDANNSSSSFSCWLLQIESVRANLIRAAEGLLHTQRRANIMSQGLFSFRNSFLFAFALFVVWLWLYAKFDYFIMQSALIASDVSCLFVCLSYLWQISFFFKFSSFSTFFSWQVYELWPNWLSKSHGQICSKSFRDIIKKVIIVRH